MPEDNIYFDWDMETIDQIIGAQNEVLARRPWATLRNREQNVWTIALPVNEVGDEKVRTIVALNIDLSITRRADNTFYMAMMSFPYGFKRRLCTNDMNPIKGHFLTLFQEKGYVAYIYNENIELNPRENHVLHKTDEEIETDITEIVLEVKIMLKEERTLKEKIRPFNKNEDTYTYFNRKTHRNEVRIRDELLTRMKIPTFKETKKMGSVQVIPFTTRRQLKSLNVLPMFVTESRFVCSMTGNMGDVRQCNFYGEQVLMNPNVAKQNGIELVWVKDLETYIYKYDPRFSLGRARVSGNSDRDENDGGDEERLLWYQTSYLESLGYQYCNGSEDWCKEPNTIMHRPQQFLYSFNYRLIHCAAIMDLNKFDAPILFWIDLHSPLYYRASIQDDGSFKYHQEGGCAAIPFNCAPEKFYGYYSEDEKGELLVTRHPIPKTRYFGVEIELESKRSTDAQIMLTEIIPELLKLGFVSGTDGSLDNGVEFRTCPQTYNILKANLKRFFEVVNPYFKVENTCGIHIHVSREDISELDLGKMMNIVYNENNNSFIRDIAGRDSGRYQEYCSGPAVLINNNTNKLKLARGNVFLNKKESVFVGPERKRMNRYSICKDTKYTAINTNHKHTVEFRLFAGTKDYEVMMKYLGFVDALINFCKQTSFSTFPFGLFSEWVATKAAFTYPELAKFLFPRREDMKGVIPNFNFNKYMERKKRKGKVA